MGVELSGIAEESARGSFSLMVGIAASTLAAAMAAIVIARLLGPSGYGLYGLSFVVPSLFVSIADFGIAPALTRFGASLRSQSKFRELASMIGSGLLFNLIVDLFVFSLVFGLSDLLAATVLHRPAMGQLVALASLMILFQGLFNLSYNAFVGLDRMGRSALMLVLRDATRVILSPLLIILGFGVAGAISGQIFGWILASLLGLWVLLVVRRGLRKSGETELQDGVASDIKTMMSYGLPLYFGSLVTTVLAQYQNIVLAFFTSNAEIGNLSAAVNFGALVAVVTTPIATALFPAFSKLDLQTSKEDLKRMFELSIRYTALLVLPVAIAVAALSSELTRVVYGTAYSSASTYLVLYMCVFLLTCLGYQVLGNFFSGIGRTIETLKVALVQLAIFLVAAPVMAGLYRVPGLVVASVFSNLVATTFALRLAAGKYGMRIDLKGSAAALVTALTSALLILPVVHYSIFPTIVNILIGIVIYAVAYLTLAPAFKAIRRTDLEMLAPILGQIRFLRPATDLIFAYETRLLNMLEGNINKTSNSRKPP
jgi:O-antigen/teichoic acid export membrane protein